MAGCTAAGTRAGETRRGLRASGGLRRRAAGGDRGGDGGDGGGTGGAGAGAGERKTG